MNNAVKWIKPRLLVQFIAAVQMKIFSESSLAILKYEMAIFGLKLASLDFKMAKELSKNIFI